MNKKSVFFFFDVVTSYNKPRFSPCATWKPDAITFTNSSVVGRDPYGIFIDRQNRIYINDKDNNRAYVWPNETSIPARNLTTNLMNPFAIFVTSNGDIYVDSGKQHGQVNKWSPNDTNPTNSMSVPTNGACWGLFVDIFDNIYCSAPNFHQVIRRLYNNTPNTTSTVAGTGNPGSASNMLHDPRGIFVDTELKLYVADSANNRIQLFLLGQSNATTLVGNGAPDTITLSCPTGIILDADGYLFISDTNNHRIVGQGPYGFRCIVGCLGTHGNRSDQLFSPWGLAFDSSGNLFVADAYNNRIQKFQLAKNDCGKNDVIFTIMRIG